MKPLDPRLLHAASAVRLHLLGTVLFGAAATALVLAQAWLLARAISGAAGGEGTADLTPVLLILAGVVLARALLAAAAETAALRSAARAKSQLRRRLLAHVTRDEHGPWLLQQTGRAGERDRDEPADAAPGAGEVATLATRGLDALDDYFARYLPQLVLAVLVPLAVLAVVARADWISAVVIAVTLPLIPVFMALVGWHTQATTRRQWHLLNRLGGHFLDVVEGLPTLAIFRRAKAQAAAIRRITEEHRSATMRTLRVAFLSAMVLELLSTIAVALVAVEVGLRLMYGMLDYQTALLVLILAPEAYLPLREVGARFHASMEGVAAAEQVFTVLERRPDRPGPPPGAGAPAVKSGPPPTEGPLPAAPPGDPPRLRFEQVALVYPGRSEPALQQISLTLPPCRRLLVYGPSGSGKSSLLSLLLRFAEPTQGRILVQDGAAPETPLERIAPSEWRRRIAWVPQQPYLFDTGVAENIALGAPGAPESAVRRAAELAEADSFIRALPDGYRTRLGERGTRLSSGQRQRIALARAFLRDAPLVLLDEPTAHLDPESAAAVRRAVHRLLTGRTGIIVAHDPGWLETGAVDEAVPVTVGRIAAEEVPR